MTRPSDRAIAQALYELSDKAFQTKDDEWVFPVLRLISDRAAELSRAPVQASEARGDWVLVPREPSDAMLAATGPVVFASAGQRWLGDGSISEQWVMDVQRDCYTAMIAAHTQAGPVD
jgi:hypothetical protein